MQDQGKRLISPSRWCSACCGSWQATMKKASRRRSRSPPGPQVRGRGRRRPLGCRFRQVDRERARRRPARPSTDVAEQKIELTFPNIVIDVLEHGGVVASRGSSPISATSERRTYEGRAGSAEARGRRYLVDFAKGSTYVLPRAADVDRQEDVAERGRLHALDRQPRRSTKTYDVVPDGVLRALHASRSSPKGEPTSGSSCSTSAIRIRRQRHAAARASSRACGSRRHRDGTVVSTTAAPSLSIARTAARATRRTSGGPASSIRTSSWASRRKPAGGRRDREAHVRRSAPTA